MNWKWFCIGFICGVVFDAACWLTSIWIRHT